jgi:hypothetical protein
MFDIDTMVVRKWYNLLCLLRERASETLGARETIASSQNANFREGIHKFSALIWLNINLLLKHRLQSTAIKITQNSHFANSFRSLNPDRAPRSTDYAVPSKRCHPLKCGRCWLKYGQPLIEILRFLCSKSTNFKLIKALSHLLRR